MKVCNSPASVPVAPDATTTGTLKQVRLAARLVLADPAAGRLLAATAAGTADPKGPLADWLYRTWWCGPSSTAWPAAGDPAELVPPVAFAPSAAAGAARLEAARRTAAAQSTGWLILAAVGTELVAARVPTWADGRESPRSAGAAPRLRAKADLVIGSSRPGLPPRPGDLVTLLAGQAGLDQEQSWWWAHTGDPARLLRGQVDRWYFNVRSLAAAVALVPHLIRVANLTGCDLSLKCPPVAAAYGRRDALVCYLPRSETAAAEAVLLRQAGEIGDLLDPKAPPLTRLILPGVGQAQDPGEPESGGEQISYGQLRSEQVATVLARLRRPPLDTALLDPVSVSDQELIEALRRVEIDPANPQQVANSQQVANPQQVSGTASSSGEEQSFRDSVKQPDLASGHGTLNNSAANGELLRFGAGPKG